MCWGLHAILACQITRHLLEASLRGPILPFVAIELYNGRGDDVSVWL